MLHSIKKIESLQSQSNTEIASHGDITTASWIQRKRKVDDFAPISKIKASECKNEIVERLGKYNKAKNVDLTRRSKNMELSDLFAKISKLYKDMPLDKFDEWRSYSYNAASARLKYLDFPVLNDEESLRNLSNRKGFGKKFMRQIREYLMTGKCQLVSEFEHDPMRVNVRNMIRIWYAHASKFFLSL